MWHRVEFVAKVHFMDADKLNEFATANFDKFGIVNEYGYNEVNTWHCDSLIKAARAAGIERNPSLYAIRSKSL